MLFPFGDHREAGEMPLVIQQQVQLDRSFGASILRPVKDRHTQGDHRGIQAHQLVLKAKFLLPLPALAGGHALALLQQLIEDGLVQLPGSVFIGVRQGGTRRGGG
jgi:hypothetical protein